MDCRWVPWVAVVIVSMPGMAAAQSGAATAAPKRPNAVERPWTTTPGSPYDRAQAVAAARVWQTEGAGQVEAGPTFPLVEAPPSALLAPGVPATAQAVRPSVVERPWTDGGNPPYDRAQAVAAERGRPDTALHGASPYPDRYRTPVPAPFRPSAATAWRGGMLLYPGLPFPAIRGWRTARSRW